MGFAKRRSGFTLIELLIIVAITAMLAAVVMPMYRAEKDTAMGNKCASNLKQLGVAMKAYGADWNGKFPSAREGGTGIGKTYLGIALSKYIPTSENLFACPADSGDKLIGGSATPFWKGLFGYYSSYAWPVGWNWVNGLPQDNPRPPYPPYNWAQLLPTSRRPALFDHRPWHRTTNEQSASWVSPIPGLSSVLFCDGHVGVAQHSWLVAVMTASGAVEPPGGP